MQSICELFSRFDVDRTAYLIFVADFPLKHIYTIANWFASKLDMSRMALIYEFGCRCHYGFVALFASVLGFCTALLSNAFYVASL